MLKVTGYVLLYQNVLADLYLENLLIIRGETLFENKYALYVALNYDSSRSSDVNGLKRLGLSSLHGKQQKLHLFNTPYKQVNENIGCWEQRITSSSFRSLTCTSS